MKGRGGVRSLPARPRMGFRRGHQRPGAVEFTGVEPRLRRGRGPRIARDRKGEPAGVRIVGFSTGPLLTTPARGGVDGWLAP